MTLIVLVLMLGLLIFIHEFGHFITAKKCGVHIYEFALGMGPKILSKKSKKDGIVYSLRLFPIGGYVQMAGEVSEDDKSVKKDGFMCNKKTWQKLVIILAGVFMNFVLAWFLIFISSLIWGGEIFSTKLTEVTPNYPASKAGIEVGDTITNINGSNIETWDKLAVVLEFKNENDFYTFTVEKENGDVKEYKVYPEMVEDEEGNLKRTFGIGTKTEVDNSFLYSLKYSFKKMGYLIEMMALVVVNLITGTLSLKALSGPVGIYGAVGTSISSGMHTVMYLVALLSLNLGFVNALPFPAFDGGRALFIIIAKIKGSPVNPKLENTIHTIGFILLILLMLYVTFQDVLKLF